MVCSLYSEQWSYAIDGNIATWETRINQSNEKRSLIPWGLIKSAIWKMNLSFSGFLRYYDVENYHECHVFVRAVRQVKVSSDWSRCIFVISFNVSKGCSEKSVA